MKSRDRIQKIIFWGFTFVIILLSILICIITEATGSIINRLDGYQYLFFIGGMLGTYLYLCSGNESIKEVFDEEKQDKKRIKGGKE